MNLYAKSILFVRRLAVLGLFVGVFSVFFGVFYYKYIPDNQAELNTRGFRVLNKLTANMQAKSQTLTQAFANVAQDHDTDRVALLSQIQQHVRFAQDSLSPANCKLDSFPVSAYIPETGVYDQSLIYRMDRCHCSIVTIADFIRPVLAPESGLFDNYVLLRKDPLLKDSTHLFDVLYTYDNKMSASYGLKIDSALTLQKNTDLSDISTLVIGGDTYVFFYQPFQLAGSQFALGGLIRKDIYDTQVKALPSGFVAGIILMILIGLIVLPYLKLFLLSPRENIHKWDVLSIVLSTYLGSAIFVIAGVYYTAGFSAHNLVEHNLQTISDSLSNDIGMDIHEADMQMETYLRQYDSLSDEFKKALSPKPEISQLERDSVDSAFAPVIYTLVARATWFDSIGLTTAKWNPFTFLSPFSKVSGYDFIQELQQKNPADTASVLSAGQSNITSEFQMFLSRRLTRRPTVPPTARQFGILLPFYLHSGMNPVLPRGYGFCLVDRRTKEVVMHSDAARDLAENFYVETNSNARVKNCIDYKLQTSIEDVDLYGTSHTLYTRPVSGRDVALIVFYDNNTYSENIFRLVHFGGEMLLYLALAFGLCLLFSTAVTSRPSKLSFNIDPVEWVRPRPRNFKSYAFTRRYFLALIGLFAAFVLLLLVARLDIRIAYYISLLLPFYALWGFLASRKKENPRFPPGTAVFKELECTGNWIHHTPTPPPAGAPPSAKTPPPTGAQPPAGTQPPFFILCLRAVRESITSSKAIFLTILLLNWLIYRLVSKPEMGHSPWILLYIFIFQLLALIGMSYWYAGIFLADSKKLISGTFSQLYTCSFYYSVLVISVFPVLGFLWYGWSVEKIQFARTDQLAIAGKNMLHIKNIAHDWLPELKPVVVHQLSKTNDIATRLMDSTGIYLAGETIEPLPKGRAQQPDTDAVNDPDQPYIAFLDEIFLITAGEYNSYSIARSDGDTTWAFATPRKGVISLTEAVHLDSPTRIGFTADPLQQDFRVRSQVADSLFSFTGLGLFHGSLLLLAIALFVLGVPRLLALTINRLFLLDFIKWKPPVQGNFLQKYFIDPTKPGKDFELDASGNRLALEAQEEYILQTMLENSFAYQRIWDDLPPRERYFLFDFAKDGYTNYKDSELLFILLNKGLLQCDGDRWRIFAISYREFILQKKGTPEMVELKGQFAVPGLWATIRIPTLIIIAACAVLLVLTQETISHRITVAVTSVGAIIPILMEITKKLGSKGSA